MDLKITDQRFLVCGASSGFGRAVAEQLLDEGASVIAVARREKKLRELEEAFGDAVSIVAGDLTDEQTHNEIETAIGNNLLHGAVINSGGPPALTPLETAIFDWDKAYKTVMRWKIELVLRLISYFTAREYGRILFIESKSDEGDRIPALVLSNSYRAAIVGFAKSLSQEIADKGVTVNVLAPGSHDTPAIERVIKKRSDESGDSLEEVREQMEKSAILWDALAIPEEFASLAAWILSPHASYVTGQTISHDRGVYQRNFRLNTGGGKQTVSIF
ncbi:MAG: SDR family oxidoreductase [Balneolaceae bacterium]|nr:SDR family oxidoreductase [Balneolaceae bacterium]